MSTTEVLEEKKVVGLPLIGEEITRFQQEKDRRHLRADAECVRQLVFERLEQIEQEVGVAEAK